MAARTTDSPIETRPVTQRFAGITGTGSEQLKDKLLFAVPKKGRLHDQCVDLLKSIGLKYSRKARLDIAMCTNLPIALIFLPAADIPKYIADSHVDIGITGEDMVAEKGVDVKTEVKLGFGKCRLCLQAPIAAGLKSPQELLNGRIVTSFPNLAGKYFDNLQTATDASAPHSTSVSYVSGSVEVACGLGLADAIVDLVESGDTMVAHQLCIVDVLMQTEAVIVSNPNTSFPHLVQKLRRRVEGVILARNYRLITYNVEKSKLDQARKITPGRRAPTVTELVEEGWVAIQAMVGSSEVHEMMDKLYDLGAQDIFVSDIANARVNAQKN